MFAGGFAIYGAVSLRLFESDPGLAGSVDGVLTLVGIAYVLMAAGEKGQGLVSKHSCDLRVVRLNGSSLDMLSAVGRELVKLAPFLLAGVLSAQLFGLAWPLIAVTAVLCGIWLLVTGKTIHDRICDTKVVGHRWTVSDGLTAKLFGHKIDKN